MVKTLWYKKKQTRVRLLASYDACAPTMHECIHMCCVWNGLKILLRLAIIERDAKTLFHICYSHAVKLVNLYCNRIYSTFMEFSCCCCCFLTMSFLPSLNHPYPYIVYTYHVFAHSLCCCSLVYICQNIYLRSIMKLNRIASRKWSFRLFLDHNSSHHRDYIAIWVFS